MTDRVDQPTIAAAREVVESMGVAIAKLEPGGTVRMSRDQFIRLARLIDHLTNQSMRPEQGSFAAPIDGICWWVPLPEHQRILSQLDATRLSLTSLKQDASTSKHILG